MQFILLMLIILYYLVRIVPSTISTKYNERVFREEMQMADDFYNKYVSKEETDKLYSMEESERVILFEKVLDELRCIVPEWKDLNVSIPYNVPHNNIFYDLVLAKKGVLSSRRHVAALSSTFVSGPYLLWSVPFFNIKPADEMAFGMSRKSYVALNKWMENTLHENGCRDARLIFAGVTKDCVEDLDSDGYPKTLFWYGFKFDFSEKTNSKRRLW